LVLLGMEHISKEPRVRAQVSRSILAPEHNARFDVEAATNRDLFRAVGVELLKGFEADITEHVTMDGLFKEKEIELWVFTPESLKELLDSNLNDPDNKDIMRLSSQLARIIHNKKVEAQEAELMKGPRRSAML